MSDPIMGELRAVKDQIARECGHDLRRLFQRLKSVEVSSPRRVVNRVTRPKQAARAR